MRDRAVLQAVEGGWRITPAQDQEFLRAYQSAVLLALKEAGQLTQAQYQYAEGKLREQLRTGEKH